MQTTETPRAALNLDDAAKTLSISRRTLERTLKDGKGPPTFRIGSAIRVRYADLMEWMAHQTSHPATAE